jgi:hypothetical protein
MDESYDREITDVVSAEALCRTPDEQGVSILDQISMASRQSLAGGYALPAQRADQSLSDLAVVPSAGG